MFTLIWWGWTNRSPYIGPSEDLPENWKFTCLGVNNKPLSYNALDILGIRNCCDLAFFGPSNFHFIVPIYPHQVRSEINFQTSATRKTLVGREICEKEPKKTNSKCFTPSTYRWLLFYGNTYNHLNFHFYSQVIASFHGKELQNPHWHTHTPNTVE